MTWRYSRQIRCNWSGDQNFRRDRQVLHRQPDAASRPGCQAGMRRHQHAGFGASHSNAKEQLAQDCFMGGAYHTTHRKGGPRKGRLYKRGKVYWITYYSAGKPIRESTGTTKQKVAERFLKDREGRVAIGASMLPRVERVRVEELLTDL